MMHTKNFVW